MATWDLGVREAEVPWQTMSVPLLGSSAKVSYTSRFERQPTVHSEKGRAKTYQIARDCSLQSTKGKCRILTKENTFLNLFAMVFEETNFKK